MRVKPEFAYRIGNGPEVYKCRCGEYFTRFDLLLNRWRWGTRDYCPCCKNKFDWSGANGAR